MAQEVPVRWLAGGEWQLPHSSEWLTSDEAARASGMSFTKRRTEYLLRRWVGKLGVAALADLPGDLRLLARIEVSHRSSGAPLAVMDGEELPVAVSISDRAGWAVCVCGEGPDRVGCDLELVEPRSRPFVTDFLTSAEQSYVAARDEADRDALVNLIWSAKESGLKVLQTGLRRDPRSLEVGLEEPDAVTGWARLSVRTAEDGVLPGWWRRAGSFLLTIASESPVAEPTVLAGSVDLETAQPVHSWLEHPRTP